MAYEIKRNDLRPRWRAQLTANGVPVDLTTAVAARFIMKKDTTAKINRATMSFIDRPTGVVEYVWTGTDTDAAGTYNVEVEVDWGGTPTEFQTFPTKGYFTVTINEDLG